MIYTFECLKCHNKFESKHAMRDPHPTTCPICGHKQIKRVYSSVGIIFNGDGFTKKTISTESGEE